jgi:hypothetical protein
VYIGVQTGESFDILNDLFVRKDIAAKIQEEEESTDQDSSSKLLPITL